MLLAAVVESPEGNVIFQLHGDAAEELGKGLRLIIDELTVTDPVVVIRPGQINFPGITLPEEITIPIPTITLLRHGAGLVQTLRFMVEDELRAGTLVEVMPHCAGSTRPVSLLYPHRRALPLRVRAFVDFIVEKSAAWRQMKL